MSHQMVINQDFLNELSRISNLIGKIGWSKLIIGEDENTVKTIVIAAIKEAIREDTSIKQNIKTLLKFTPLHSFIVEIVQTDYPEHKDYLQKLLILI